jgi:hypothetical protein
VQAPLKAPNLAIVAALLSVALIREFTPPLVAAVGRPRPANTRTGLPRGTRR